MKKIFLDDAVLRDSDNNFVGLSRLSHRCLYVLAQNEGRVSTYGYLLEHVWQDSKDDISNPAWAYGYGVPKVHALVNRLRKKIVALGVDEPHDYLPSVREWGYTCYNIMYVDSGVLSPKPPKLGPAQHFHLTVNEEMLFKALSNELLVDKTERQLALRLGVGIHSIQHYRKGLYSKIGAVSRAHATQIAQQYYASKGGAA